MPQLDLFPMARLLLCCVVTVLAAELFGVVSGLAAELPDIQYVAGRFPPYTLTNAGDPNLGAGPTAALVSSLGKRIGRAGPLLIQPLARALTTAEHQPNTLIALVARNPEREGRFQWVCPVLDYDAVMFRRHDRPDVAAKDLNELKRYRIAGLNRDMKTEYLLRNGVPVASVTADEGDAARLLLHGRVEAMPGHPATIRMQLREMGEADDVLTPFLPLPELNTKLYLAFGTGTGPDVVLAVREACRAMTASGEIRALLQQAPMQH